MFSMTAESTDGSDPERVQVNVTFKRPTLQSLETQFPSALDDSERVRRAVDQALDFGHATHVSLSRS